MVHGEILSIYPLDGNWTRVRREYWWKALAFVDLPRRPSALLVGLGGGTQVHLLHRLASPRLITVIERDPVIVSVASDWFGLDRVGSSRSSAPTPRPRSPGSRGPDASSTT